MIVPAHRRVVRFEIFGDPDVLQLNDEPMPQPAPGEVLVAVEAIGVNFADTMIRRGEYRRDQPLPDVPGMEAAGRVVASRSDRHRVGDHVALFLEQGGGYADHVVVSGELAFAITADVSSEQVAATFLQGVTAWYAVHRFGAVQPGDLVLVTGAAGGLGTMEIQLAREAGGSVIGSASTAAKREYVLSQGCDYAVPADAAELHAAIKNISTRGVDVVLDGVGGDVFVAALAATARSGRVVVVGSATQQPAMLDVRHLLPRGQTVSGFVIRNIMDVDQFEPQRGLDAVLERTAEGRLVAQIETLPLSQAAEAHRRLEERSVCGKLVLIP